MNIERVIKFTSVAASRVGAVGCLLLAAAAAPGAIAASVAGDSWAYRVINGYNNEVRGNIRYRIDKVEDGEGLADPGGEIKDDAGLGLPEDAAPDPAVQAQDEHVPEVVEADEGDGGEGQRPQDREVSRRRDEGHGEEGHR